MFGLGRQGRGRTRDARVPGARGKAAGALTAAAGAVRDTAVESAREGITKVSEKIGKAAGAGIAVAATAAADAAGYHPSPLIAVGAAYAGMKVGGLAGRAMNAGLDRINAGRGGGPIGSVMAELSMVLQTLDQVGRGIAEVVDSVNKAQAHFQKVSRGGGNNLLNSAVRACRQAPVRLEEGVDEVKHAQDLVGKHLVAMATAGG
ncbi:hypothetical protein MRQ36_27490 [Micromonospora sp. R77]|nr:hypothetical protein [Micromonospora sp. R77]